MGTENLRKFFADDRDHTIAGTIAVHKGESSHFYVNAEKNVVVSVVLHHLEQEVWANLHNGPGVWTVPSVGTEVLLATDGGDIEGELYLLGTYGVTNSANAAAPEDLGPNTYNVVVSGNINLIVAPGSTINLCNDLGNARRLAFHDELVALTNHVDAQFSASNGHIHTVSGLATTVMTTVTAPAATPPTVPAPTPVGTEIVRGE